MAIQSAILDRVVLVRWPVQVTAEDVTALDDVMTEARTSLGRPMYHVGLLPEGIEMPPVAIQKPLIKRVLKMQHAFESMHCVLEGNSIKEKLGRRFLQGMVRMFGLKEKAYVHAQAIDALKLLQGKLGQEAAAILEGARGKGLLG